MKIETALLACLVCTPAAMADTLAPPPAAPRQDVTDTYFGITVQDPYRWLENGADPRTQAWSAAENDRARAYVNALPQRPAIHAELARIYHGASDAYSGLSARGDAVFANYFDPAKQQAMLVVLNASADPGSRRILLDPNTLDPSGHTAIDWWVASPDGKRIAVSLSRNGSEDGDLHLYDTATGRELEPAIAHVQFATAGGSLAWAADGNGFWYTRYPGEGTPEADRHYNIQVYEHVLGQDWHRDALALDQKDGLERISEVFLANAQDKPAIIAMVQRGDGGTFAQFLLRHGQDPVRLSTYEDGVVAAVMGPDGAIYGVSHKDAPNGKIVRLAAKDIAPGALARAPVIVPESRGAIRTDGIEEGVPSIIFSGNRLILRYMEGGPTTVRVFALDGSGGAEIPLPAISDVREADPLKNGDVLFRISSYLKPTYFARWSPGTGTVSPTPMAQTSPADFSDATLARVFATSKDGTKIPLTIISRKGTALNGSNATLLYGYGGYGISMTPAFGGAMLRTWLDAGGVYAVANIRGGAEYGERWHMGGALTAKQNVFDDFTAAAEYLLSAHWTSHDKLALMGESNGGLLMGAMITQHPGLPRAVVSRVGIYDMLRVELDPNGAFNTTEFGSVKNEAQFRALYAYSPYHHVEKGTHYPAMFFETGATDARVNPAHSRKFVAALQWADASSLPVLLETDAKAGHGMGDPLDTVIDKEADIMAFLTDQLAMQLNAK